MEVQLCVRFPDSARLLAVEVWECICIMGYGNAFVLWDIGMHMFSGMPTDARAKGFCHVPYKLLGNRLRCSFRGAHKEDVTCGPQGGRYLWLV